MAGKRIAATDEVLPLQFCPHLLHLLLVGEQIGSEALDGLSSTLDEMIWVDRSRKMRPGIPPLGGPTDVDGPRWDSLGLPVEDPRHQRRP